MTDDHPQRTGQQNNAIHLYFDMVAKALNSAGEYRIVYVGSRKFTRLWDGEFVKADIWKPIQRAEFGTTSTRDMSTIGPSIVYDHMNAFISGEFGLYIPFPDRHGEAHREAA